MNRWYIHPTSDGRYKALARSADGRSVLVGPPHRGVEACRQYIQESWCGGAMFPSPLSGELESDQITRRMEWRLSRGLKVCA